MGEPLTTIQNATEIFVSAVTAGELACLQERNRIELSTHWRTWFQNGIKVNGWSVLPIDLETMEEAYSLPGDFHSDLADRVITATARLHRLTVLTTDRKILDYPHVNSAW